MEPRAKRRSVRRALAGAAAALAVGLFLLNAIEAARSVARQRAADRVCTAAGERRWADALALSHEAVGPHPEGRIAAECRCWALLARGRDAECTALIDRLLAEPEAAGWVPEPALAKRVLRARLDGGRAAEAARLAKRMTRAHPEDLDLFHFEHRARSLTEGEEVVLRDLETRLAASEEAPLALRLAVAGLRKQRGEPEAMLRALGEDPPDVPVARLPPWFEARAQAWAALGRQDRVAETYARWRAMGGSPAKVDALYALQLSFGGLRDPDRPLGALLRDALDDRRQIGDPAIVEALYERLIAHLLASGERERALEVYDEAARQLTLTTITRKQIENAQTAASAMDPRARGDAGPRPGALVFRLPAEAPTGSLLLAPGPEAPPDAPYERLPLGPGAPIRAERTPAATPVRWVFRDEEGRIRASGSAWPSSASRTEIAIRPGPPRAPDPPPRLEPAPPDGRRRVFVLIPDCMDWRLVQYLRARGELPVLDHLLDSGHRAVLESDPPLTAAAMESLVWPTRSQQITLVSLLHRLGLEAAGLASVGHNPLRFLEPLLPEAAGLFETAGAGDRVAANLLFSHGNIDAGRNALLTGPHGRERRARPIRGVRPLRPEERAAFPRLAAAGAQYRDLVETTAAELDTAVEMAREGLVDLLMLRIEPLDIATHGLYSELARTAQDDGESMLLDFYRYIDLRIAEVASALDGDDVLIVMSDHGIRTAMEHSTDAIFVAWGGGVPEGRAPGMPALRGVPRAIAELLGIETAWPETGVARWGHTPSGGDV